MINHEMLGLKIVGVPQNLIADARQPQPRLQELLKKGATDPLLAAMERVLKIATESSDVSNVNFGVFGSYSDIDFTIYGKVENQKVCQTMQRLYADPESGFSNEFSSVEVMRGKDWRFKNFEVKDFVWHQERKMIYGLYDNRKSLSLLKLGVKSLPNMTLKHV